MDLLCGKGIHRFAAIYYSFPPPPDAKSTVLTKKTEKRFRALHELHYNLLVSGGISLLLFSPFHQGAAAVLCIKAQKIMVYLLVNTSIKVCSFFSPPCCRFFLSVCDFPEFVFQFSSHILSRLLWRFSF